MTDTYDVVILGAGPTGEHAAGRLRKRGLSVALVEAELAGGECSYYACMPSKTLLRPGAVLATARRVPGVREAVTGELSAEAALARRDWMTSDLHDDGQVEWIASVGATLVRGEGRLAGVRRVAVTTPAGGEVELEARRAVIVATGSAPAVPPVPGLAEARPWSNREITSAKQVPASLIVLGGGPVGVEMAQAWFRLGCASVLLLEVGERLLAAAEPFAGELLKEALVAEGIDVRTGAHLASVGREGDGPFRALLDDGSEQVAEELLVAAGRRPRVDGIGLESVGLAVGRALETDDHLRARGVEGEWLYAIGDVNGRAALTHMGKYQARVAVDTICGDEIEDVADHGIAPGVVFTDPEVSWVGLTEAAAREQGIAARVVSCPLESVAAAAIWGEELTGRCQLVVDTERETIVGATFVGSDTAELLHGATIAIAGGVPLTTLRHAVAAFPSLSEVWLELVEGYFLPDVASA
ncbi:MAG TPA: NAD(P)/FAD-dependent oxidoreductase [Acidimicrobiales bacterium]|nr:NAD(P)/FAD-dependent oxidoreductase [Acidimicrobiales bacterium]